MDTKPPRERLLSLDAFRGATIAAMILVNNSGDYSHTWWPLLHQPWHGWTPTDLVFPFFLFMVGMSLTFSQRLAFRPALVRALKLVAFGLLVNFTAVGLVGGGLLLLVLAVLWGEAAPAWLLFPVNKNLWSPSFVLLTGGLAAAFFGLTWWLVDVRGLRAWTGPFVTYGKNAIAVYVGSEVLAGAWGTIGWAGADGVVRTLQERLHQLLFASWLPPVLAAFAFALANVVLWWAVARWMDRRGVYLKV